MKKKINFLVISLLISVHLCSQDKTELEKLAKRNQINHISNSFQDLKDGLFYYYQNDIDSLGENKIYNNALLNIYFKNIISSYATSTGDLSFNNYFANINSSDGTLTLGKSFRLDNFYISSEKRKANKLLKPIKKIGNLLTIYTKANYSNGFADIYSEKEIDDVKTFKLKSDLGIGFKYTHIFNGSTTTLNKKKIKDFRETFVKSAISSKISSYEKNELNSELAILNYNVTDENIKKKNKQKLVQSKYFDFYRQVLEEELKYAASQGFISSSTVSWLSFSAYIPITNRIISYTLNNEDILEQEYKDYNFTLTYNILFNKNNFGFLKNTSSKITFETSYFKTNNFIANNDSPVKFQEIIKDNSGTLVEGTSTNVFSGDYNPFWGKSLKGEIAFLFLNNSIGLSAAGELTYGDIENQNWKLGIPFSLKDKDGENTVNFELQLREINKFRFVGISVGYNFGKFVK
ncbi:hypothetical protein [Polaribacter marinivivus]|uniref:DUF5723 domain-containing protein n=1 Tax=Polaribacter marinivivus TaxID=1524260 RepID=A0ABV8RA07_9FLAO